MPIYDYICKKCGNYQEDVFAKPEESIKCLVCNADMHQQMAEIQFKIGDSFVIQHKRKYGNNHHVVPKSKDNGVKLYGQPKSKK